MRKRNLKIGFIIMGMVVLSLFLFACRGQKPFRNLNGESIKAATVEIYPPDGQVSLNEAEIEQLTEILQTLVIYKRDDTYSAYDGQFVLFTLEDTNGTTTQILALNPFVAINGNGYRTKYGPCQELNAFANQIANKS